METAHANCSPLTLRSPAIAARCGRRRRAQPPRPTGRNGLVNFPDCEGAIANVAGSAGNTPLNGHGVIALTDGGFEC